MNSRKLKRVILGLFLSFIACCIVVAGLFVSDSFVYSPDTVAISCMESNSKVTVRSVSGYRMFEPESPIATVIFYPASYVEFRAYAPLMQELAGRGIQSIICKMPGDLVILGKNKADVAKTLYPDIENCYMAGHGYGGTTASAYAANNEDDFNGVILLAAKPSNKLADTDLSCLSIYGDCDGKKSLSDFEKYRKYYPYNTVEFLIEGANHSQFGSFGTLSGDDNAEISEEEQLRITADKIAEFIKNDIADRDREENTENKTSAEVSTNKTADTEETTKKTTAKKTASKSKKSTKNAK